MEATIVVGLIIALAITVYEYRRDRGLPPGPRRLPLIGNLHQAPTDVPWLTFQKWTKQYGPIVSVQFGLNTLILIADATIARDLLDKRGNIYSDRPRMVMAGENLTKGMHMLIRRYNDRYRLHQRIDAPSLAPRASQTYYPVQDLESKQLLLEFLTRNDFQKIFERYAGSVAYSLAYGFRLETGDEQTLKDAHRVQDNFAYAGRVGTWIVDALPFLNYLPPALAPWKRTAEEFFKIESRLHMTNMERGLSTKAWNWTKEFSSTKEAAQISQLELAYNIGIVADAALDTTVVQMRMFVLAALSYPAFIAQAQKELDEVVGKDRLPTLDDRPRLPYMTAVVEESLRWRSIAPGGVPHATTHEDTYGGYRIPKGATVAGLHWAMSLDEKRFDRPLEFLPERWLKKESEDQDPNTSAYFTNFFGYGRRICPARHIARNSLFLAFARLLWGFNIKHAVDGDGKPKEVDDMAFTSGFLSAPFPFEAVFEPRSSHAKAVIEREWENAEKDVDVILNSVREEQTKHRFRD